MAESNREMLDRFLADGVIALERAPLLDEAPPPIEGPDLADRVEGMLLGLAIGDALGNTTEGLTPQMRSQIHGEIRDYLPNPRARLRPVGLPTDDTQLAFWTLERLLEDGGLDAERLAGRFCEDRIVGVGGTVSTFLHNHCTLGKPWWEAGPRSAGNGALMRIAPVLIPHLASPSPGLWADTALAAMITHNDPASTGSCIAFVRLLWHALGMEAPPAPGWWLDEFCGTLRELEGETAYRPRATRILYEGPVWEFADTEVRTALRAGAAVSDACEEWYSGAFLLETVPSVLYILARFAHDPERAIIRAVSDTVDNDTIGAIVGAAVGALHGRRGLPDRWVDGLLGRTTERDDGRVFELIEAAKERWVASR